MKEIAVNSTSVPGRCLWEGKSFTVELVKQFRSVPNVIVVTESRTTPTARPPVRPDSRVSPQYNNYIQHNPLFMLETIHNETVHSFSGSLRESKSHGRA
jgi:hypothetical protein